MKRKGERRRRRRRRKGRYERVDGDGGLVIVGHSRGGCVMVTLHRDGKALCFLLL
jgi:hypothetical protein